MFRITTLGTASVRRDDGVPVSLDVQSAKRTALLVFLATARPRGPQRRDTIVGMLWPELDDVRARAALRQSLHGLRKALGEHAIVSYGLEGIELAASAATCDAWEFEHALAVRDHRRALGLYAGDFLAGLHVADAPEFERWIDAERSRVRAAAAAAAWALATESADCRAPDVARIVRTAVQLTGVDETALRRGMRLLADGGDRGAAIDLYERFATDLRRELDVDVDPNTQALANDIRRSSLAAASRAEPPASSVLTARFDECVLSPAASVRPHRSMYPRVWLGAVVGLLALGFVARHSVAANSTIDPRRLEVISFENETPFVALDTVARQVTLETQSSLTAIQGAVVTAEPGTGGTRVRGVIRPEGDSARLTAEVIDVRTGTIVRTLSRALTAPSQARGLVTAFTDRLTAAVATTLYPGWGNALSQPPSYAAYQLFATGMRDIKRERHADAITSFRRAFAADSTFTAAGIIAAMELYQVRDFAAAESLVTAIERHHESLRPIDDHLLEWTKRSLRGDRFGARAEMQAVAELAPQADLAWLQLAIDNVETSRPRQGLDALDHIDTTAQFGQGWAAYWATRIEALHLLGDHTRELEVARDGLAKNPELRVLVTYELRALAALGKIGELNARLRLLPTGADSGSSAAETAVRETAQELAAHGRPVAAKALLDRLAASYADVEPGSRHASTPLSAARTFYLAHDDGKAAAIYDSVFRAHPRCLDCAGVLGVLAARRGDSLRVARYEQMLTDARAGAPNRSLGRSLLWRARIAATLGDRAKAAALIASAFAGGLEFDVMTHADPDLLGVNADSIYRAFAAVR